MNAEKYKQEGIVEQFVMGLCDEAQLNQIAKDRAEDAAVDQLFSEAEQQWESYWMKQPRQPSSTVDANIKSIWQQPIAAAPIQQMQSRNYRWWAAAAAVLLCISIVSNFFQYQSQQRLWQMISAEKQAPLPLSDYAVLTQPDITPVALYGQGSHTICRCTLYWDKKTGKAYLMIHHLPLTNARKDYQLWVKINGKMQAIGVVDDSIRGRFIELEGIPKQAQSFFVTLENAGNVSEPNLDELYLAGSV